MGTLPQIKNDLDKLEAVWGQELNDQKRNLSELRKQLAKAMEKEGVLEKQVYELKHQISRQPESGIRKVDEAIEFMRNVSYKIDRHVTISPYVIFQLSIAGHSPRFVVYGQEIFRTNHEFILANKSTPIGEFTNWALAESFARTLAEPHTYEQCCITVCENDAAEFESKCNDLLTHSYVCRSCECGFIDDQSRDFCLSFQAIFIHKDYEG